LLSWPNKQATEARRQPFFEIVDALPSRPSTDLVFGAELRGERCLILFGERSCEMPQPLGHNNFNACIRENARSSQMAEINVQSY